MFNKTKIIGWLAKKAAAAKALAILHAPTALAIAGGALIVWALIETAKAASTPSEEANSAIDDLEDANVALENALNDPNSDAKTIDTLRGDKRRALRRAASAKIKQYKKPIVIASFGLAAIGGGYAWMFNRYRTTATMLATTAATLKLVDRNCRDAFGDNATNVLYSENFNAEEFKGKVLKKFEQSEGKGGLQDANFPTANDDIAEISADIIGDEDIPERSIYHYNRYTAEDGCYIKGVDNQLCYLRSKLMKLQSELDNEPDVTFLSRGYVLRTLGLRGATVHPKNASGKLQVERDWKWGWCKGDTIDIGLSKLFSQLTKNLSDPDWIDYLNEQYNDIILHLNDSPEALYAACLYDEDNPSFIGKIPKRFRSLFEGIARKVVGGHKEAIGG